MKITGVKSGLFSVMISALMIILLSIFAYRWSTQIESSNQKIELLQQTIEQKNAEMQSLKESHESKMKIIQSKLNSRNWADYYTKELLIKLVDNNHQAYYIRNEILYYNKDMTKEEASYQALWIYSWSVENNVRPYLTTAVFVKESQLRQYNPDGSVLTSRAGARGIGQLMPVIERIYGVDAEIFEENVKGTTLFLKDLKHMYDGDLDGMLGHYNGGSRPYEKIKEYKETREFVEVVTLIYDSMVEKYS